VTAATIGYGDLDLDVRLPTDVSVRVVRVPAPAHVEDPSDALARVAHAIDHPIDAPPLEEAARGAESVAVVIPDGTRQAAADVYLLPVLSRLARAGIGPDRTKLVIARGIHAATPRRYVEAILGREMMDVLRPVQSAPGSPEVNVTIGEDPEIGPVRVHQNVAQADLVVLTGSIRPHHLAGFGGGPKALVPGVAQRETVLAAHRLTLDALVRPDGSIRSAAGRIEGNSFYAALLRVARAFEKTWLLNVVLDMEGSICAAAAGEVGAAHAAAVAAWREAYPAPEPEPHDLAIIGVEGPQASNLIQGHKALLRATAWVKPGAPIVWAVRAPDGPGHPALLQWFSAGKPPRHLAALRRDFHPYGLTAYSMRRIAKDHPVYVVSEMSRDILRPMGFLPCKDLQSALELACAENAVKTAVVLP
jgi:nickel-dependent lactate racemase